MDQRAGENPDRTSHKRGQCPRSTLGRIQKAITGFLIQTRDVPVVRRVFFLNHLGIIHLPLDHLKFGNDRRIGDFPEARECVAIFGDITHPHFERAKVEELAGLVDRRVVERSVHHHICIFRTTIFLGVSANTHNFVGIVIHRTFRIVLVVIVKAFFWNSSWYSHCCAGWENRTPAQSLENSYSTIKLIPQYLCKK